MKTSLCVGSCWLAMVLSAVAADFSGVSPSGKLSFGSKGEKDLLVWKTDHPAEKALIYHEEAVFIQSAEISPDDVWIALEHGGSSLGHSILFFKRDKGLDFFLVGGGEKDPDPADKVGALALKSVGITENVLDHSYLHVVKWGPKSEWLFVALDAKGVASGKKVQVTNWRCVYNPVTHEVRTIKDNPGKVEVTAK